MPPALLLSTWRKPHGTQAPSSAHVDCKDEKAQVKQPQSGTRSGSPNQQQLQEWAPSQVICLQRIERQEHESFVKLKADERSRNSILNSSQATIKASEDDSIGDTNNNSEQTRDDDEQEVQDFDVDEIFHLSPATCPNMRDDPEPVVSSPDPSVDTANQRSFPSERNNEADAALKLKIFTGSWNMAAKDPFADKKGEYIGDAMAALSLTEFLPLGYDLYVVGTQEKVSKHLHSAVLARLNFSASYSSTEAPQSHQSNSNASFTTPRYIRLDLHPSQPTRERSKLTPSSVPLSPVFHRLRRDNNSSEFNDSFVDSVLRASSFGLASSSVTSNGTSSFGSGLSSSFIGTTSTTATKDSTTAEYPGKLKRSTTKERHRSAREVRGRGDGAFLHSKSTSIAIYVAVHLEPAIEVIRVGAHKFSFTSGSKGGLAVMLRFAGDQTITFVNCHLEANRPALRRQQLDTLTRKLPKTLGFGDSSSSKGGMDLASCSDHVVWMGDFNYRIHSLDGETVLKLLGSNRHMELHDRYDSMKDDMDFVAGMQRFREPRKWPTFFPTYKKLPNRTSGVSMTSENPSWPLQVYRVRYKEPFYKGGKVKARVPGWCDRILHCSAPAWQHYLEVEKVVCRLERGDDEDSVSDGRCGNGSLRENYRSVNDALRGSDHSPVFCTFLWTVMGGGQQMH